MTSSAFDHLTAALADRYALQRELGRGGMATVYLATDLKHERPVALKVLKPELAAVLGADRFLREVKTTAQLTHPHILPLHDSGNADGFLYYVMPYVEGESLRDRLTREKQLPLDDALQISREVADALSYAHSHGVIHRDIKPENILLESGHAVVADFGIARAIDQAGGEKLTGTGIALGTPAYMSPEQAAGSKDLDGRSDLYSLGCVLYEMLAGQPPFAGPTLESVIHQHLTAEPPSITVIRPAVPGWVAAALTRSLAKTPADRFNPVAQFAEAIAPRASTAEVPVRARRWSRVWLGWAAGLVLVAALVTSLVVWGPLGRVLGGGGGGLPAARPWVIVADFEGTADPSYRRAAQDLVGTVLDQSTVVATLPTEQILLGLELAGKPETAVVTEAVARELAVRASIGSVVTGQVDHVGSAYSVLLRLVRAESGEVLAAENHTASGDDALIPTIETAVRGLRARLGERRASLDAGRPMPQVMTPSFAAYRKYAEAVRLHAVEGDYREAARLQREALALDPDFASAWSWLGELLFYHLGQPDSGFAAWNEALRRSDRLTSGERLLLEHRIAVNRWHLREAVEIDQKRQRADPRSVGLGITLFYLHNQPEALLKAEDRAATDWPFRSQAAARNRAIALIVAGRRAEARTAAAGMANEAERLGMLLYAAGLDAAWGEVDSLVRQLMPVNRRLAQQWQAILHLAHGEAREGESILAGLDQRPWPLFSLSAGRPVQRAAKPDTTWEGAVTAALAGDTAEARAALPRLTTDTLDYRVESGFWRAAVQAASAWRAGDWQGVVRQTGPMIRERPSLGPHIGPLIRWITADAYEQLGRLDSAAALLGDLVEPTRLDGPPLSTQAYAAAHSYLQQHLIVLLARLGRVEEARRHWRIFSETFTQPDPEVAHLVDEARAALQAAERKAG
jgi:tetratricopeptide (TPR) repeat protein